MDSYFDVINAIPDPPLEIQSIPFTMCSIQYNATDPGKQEAIVAFLENNQWTQEKLKAGVARQVWIHSCSQIKGVDPKTAPVSVEGGKRYAVTRYNGTWEIVSLKER